MASDNLRQVGNYLKDTRKKANQALNRYSKNLPRVEATRDIFDPSVHFEMFFKTDGEKEISLDIGFKKPPPLRGCKSGCHTAACEEYTLGAGNHIIALDHLPIAGTVDAFVNGEILSDGQFYIHGGASVFVQGGSLASNIIVVCYIWDNCAE